MPRTLDSVSADFCDHARLIPGRSDADLLHALGEAFARLPYENLTKLLAKHAPADPEAPRLPRRREPGRVLAEHLAWGTGGTCFALTELFRRVLAGLGYRCRPVLCDMRAGPDTHCALVVDLPDGPWLLDPGYLLHRPLPLRPGAEQVRASDVGEVRLTGAEDGATYAVATFGVPRYVAKMAPVSPERFAALWEVSFAWTGMRDVHASRATGDGYAYLHGRNLRLRTSAGKANEKLAGREAEVVAARFGIAPEVVRRAYALVDELRGRGPRA